MFFASVSIQSETSYVKEKIETGFRTKTHRARQGADASNGYFYLGASCPCISKSSFAKWKDWLPFTPSDWFCFCFFFNSDDDLYLNSDDDDNEDMRS